MWAIERRIQLEDLQEELNAHIFVRDPKDCAVDPCGRMTWLVEGELAAVVVSQDPLHSDRAYLIALHELGHVHVQKSRGRTTILREEALAWRWAFAQAQGLTMTPELWAWMVEILRNDLDNYATEHFELLKEAEHGSR